MSVPKVRKIRESLCTLRLAKTQQVGNGLVDVASPITLWMLSEMTQDRVMEGRLRRQC